MTYIAYQLDDGKFVQLRELRHRSNDRAVDVFMAEKRIADNSAVLDCISDHYTIIDCHDGRCFHVCRDDMTPFDDASV